MLPALARSRGSLDPATAPRLWAARRRPALVGSAGLTPAAAASAALAAAAAGGGGGLGRRWGAGRRTALGLGSRQPTRRASAVGPPGFSGRQAAHRASAAAPALAPGFGGRRSAPGASGLRAGGLACRAASAGSYNWEQTDGPEHEVRIYVPVGEEVRAKDVAFELKGQRLRLGFRGQEPLVDGALWGPVEPEESCWTFEQFPGQRMLVVNLQTSSPGVSWEYLLDPDSSENSELDPGLQAAASDWEEERDLEEGGGTSSSAGHSPDQRIKELLRMPDDEFCLEDIGTSWESYFAMRGFVPQNMEACTGALSVPLTILAALQLFGLRFSPGEQVRVDLPGSRILELANMDLVYEELGRAFPDNDVLLRLVGPELGRDLQLREGVTDLGNIFLTFHRMMYQDLLRQDLEAGVPPPHLAVAFHAGVQMHDSWRPAVESVISRGIPMAVTGYSLSDIAAGLRKLREGCDPQPRIVFEGVNHFACSERLLVDEVRETVSLCPEAGGGAEESSASSGAVLQTALRDAEDVERAGGLEQLLQRVDAQRAEVVSINSWWYLLRGPA